MGRVQPTVPEGKALVVLLTGAPPALAVDVTSKKDYDHVYRIIGGNWKTSELFLLDKEVAAANLEVRNALVSQ